MKDTLTSGSGGAEGAGAAGAGGAAVVGTSLSTLLTRHVLRDGEVVILILKPSLWYIVLSSLRVAAAVLILLIAAIRLDPHTLHTVGWVEAAALLIAGRVMWAVLQWMGRLYILTDMRIVRVAGIFTVDIFDCPLRKVARTRVIRTSRERLLALGSIEIVPQDENIPVGLWQTIRHPRQVQEQIVAAIRKAKNGGHPTEG